VNQYSDSKNLLDRFFAVKAAGQIAIEAKSKWLEAVIRNKKEFFSVRAEALKQLVEGKSKLADELLLVALKSKDVQLQKEAIQLAVSPSGDLFKEIEQLRKVNSYQPRHDAVNGSISFENKVSNDLLKDQYCAYNPGVLAHQVYITT